MKSVEEIRALLLTPTTMRAAGLDGRNPARLVARGALVRVRRGVYVRTEDLATLRHEEVGVMQVVAYALATRVPPVFCQESAALLHGLSFRSLPARIHLLATDSHGHGARDVAVHRKAEGVCTSVAGLRVTGLARTLVDCAHSLPRDEALVAVESALWRGDAPSGALEAGAAWKSSALERDVRAGITNSSAPGRRSAALLLPLMSSCSESPGETLSKSVVFDAGLARPEQQFRIGPFRTDFAWPDARVVLEFDGSLKYADDAAAAGAIRAERRRQLQLNREGWTVLRTDWNEVTKHPWTLIQRLRAAGVPSVS